LHKFCPEDGCSIFLRSVGTHYQTKLCRAVDEHKLILAVVVFVFTVYFTHSCTDV